MEDKGMKQNNKRFMRIATVLATLLSMAALSACGSRDASAPAAESTQAADVQLETVQAETEAVNESTNAETGTDTSKTAKGP